MKKPLDLSPSTLKHSSSTHHVTQHVATVAGLKGGAKKSQVWRYFKHPDIAVTRGTLLGTEASDGGPTGTVLDRSKTQCLLCGTQLAFNNSGTTTTMLNHLKSRHNSVVPFECSRRSSSHRSGSASMAPSSARSLVPPPVANLAFTASSSSSSSSPASSPLKSVSSTVKGSSLISSSMEPQVPGRCSIPDELLPSPESAAGGTTGPRSEPTEFTMQHMDCLLLQHRQASAMAAAARHSHPHQLAAFSQVPSSAEPHTSNAFSPRPKTNLQSGSGKASQSTNNGAALSRGISAVPNNLAPQTATGTEGHSNSVSSLLNNMAPPAPSMASLQLLLQNPLFFNVLMSMSNNPLSAMLASSMPTNAIERTAAGQHQGLINGSNSPAASACTSDSQQTTEEQLLDLTSSAKSLLNTGIRLKSENGLHVTTSASISPRHSSPSLQEMELQPTDLSTGKSPREKSKRKQVKPKRRDEKCMAASSPLQNGEVSPLEMCEEKKSLLSNVLRFLILNNLPLCVAVEDSFQYLLKEEVTLRELSAVMHHSLMVEALKSTSMWAEESSRASPLVVFLAKSRSHPQKEFVELALLSSTTWRPLEVWPTEVVAGRVKEMSAKCEDSFQQRSIWIILTEETVKTRKSLDLSAAFHQENSRWVAVPCFRSSVRKVLQEAGNQFEPLLGSEAWRRSEQLVAELIDKFPVENLTQVYQALLRLQHLRMKLAGLREVLTFVSTSLEQIYLQGTVKYLVLAAAWLHPEVKHEVEQSCSEAQLQDLMLWILGHTSRAAPHWEPLGRELLLKYRQTLSMHSSPAADINGNRNFSVELNTPSSSITSWYTDFLQALTSTSAAVGVEVSWSEVFRVVVQPWLTVPASSSSPSHSTGVDNEDETHIPSRVAIEDVGAFVFLQRLWRQQQHPKTTTAGVAIASS